MHWSHFTLLSLFYFGENIHRHHGSLVLLQDVVWARIENGIQVRAPVNPRQTFVLIILSPTDPG